MSTELRDLLELASEDLPEVDLAEHAWHVAAAQRRAVRRRVLLGAGGLAAAGALVTVLLRDDEAALPARTPSSGTTSGVHLDEQVVGSVRVSMAPSTLDEAFLPRYPDAALLALPEVLGPRTDLAVLAPDGVRGVDAGVRAVFLVHEAGGGYHPVVYLPRATPALLVVPHARLDAVRGASGAVGPVLGPRTIDDARRRLVFAQRRAVVVVDVRDASVLELPVPDGDLLHAGWATDGRTVVARSGVAEWLVDTQTREVRRSEVPARPDYEDLARSRDGETLLRSFAGSGTLTDTRVVRGTSAEPYGESVANTEAWAASGVYLDQALAGRIGRYQGLLAAQDDLSITPRVLATPDEVGVPKDAYRPLGWGPRDTLLLESRSYRGSDRGAHRRILAWDVIGARLFRVADVEGSVTGTGGFTGLYAI